MKLIPYIVSALCGLIFILWLSIALSVHMEIRVPIEHDRSDVLTNQEQLNTGTLTLGSAKPADLPGLWPSFRGPDWTNIAQTTTTLAREWPEGGPPVVWKIEVAMGHAGVAVRNGRVYLLDYDLDKKEDVVRCLSLATGEEIWRYSYSVKIKQNHGITRTIPAVTDEYVVTMGPKCHVLCLKADTGERVWAIDLVTDCGTIVPQWYAGQCPVIDGDRVILAPGAQPMMMAVELATGRRIWETTGHEDAGQTHTSITPIEFDGHRQYVYSANRTIFGVDATDGTILWTYPWKSIFANVPSPTFIAPDRIFVTGGYEMGSDMIRLQSDGQGGIEAKQVFHLEEKVFGVEQQTPLYYKDHLFGTTRTGEMSCLDLDGNIVWSSGQVRFGLGPFLIANDMILALEDESCTLRLAEASLTGWEELASAQMIDGHEAWAPMALADSLLILRDVTQLICVDLAE